MKDSLPLIACLLATVIPVFFARVEAAPLWLGLQALALGWISLTRHPEVDTHAWAAGLEVLVVRAWLVPTVLRRALTNHASARLDLMPSNLFAWGVATTLIILAFRFGDGARMDARALTLGVVAATTMIAFLVLATNRAPAAQLVALLFMENALALFESLLPEPWPLPVHLAVSGVYGLSAMVGSWLVRDQAVEVVQHEPATEKL
jgi:hydrogenase-4 membrane subunit HyfE